MVRPDLQEILKEFRRGLESIYGDRLVKVILYGSQARGDARPDSNVDVLVVLVVLRSLPTLEEREETYARLSDLCLAHEMVISVQFMPERDYATRQIPFLRNIRHEGLPV